MGSPAPRFQIVETDYSNSCYLSAFASITKLGVYEAYVLLRGGPPPKQYSGTIEWPLPDFHVRLLELGFEHLPSRRYTQTKRDSLVVVGWDRRRDCPTMHVVVWDHVARVRIDCCGADTTVRYKGVVVEAYTLTEEARAKLVTGCVRGLRRPRAEVQAERETQKREAEEQEARDLEYVRQYRVRIAEERELRERARVERIARTQAALPGAIVHEDLSIFLGA